MAWRGTGIGYGYGNGQDSPSAPSLWGRFFAAAYRAVTSLSSFPHGQYRPRASPVMQIMCRLFPLIFLIPNQHEDKMYPPRRRRWGAGGSASCSESRWKSFGKTIVQSFAAIGGLVKSARPDGTPVGRHAVITVAMLTFCPLLKLE